ncbi:MAG: glycosyltransferase family 4 protein [Anaerolineales bacterium]|nr:glycosyltransferase family 4 protein [Anaerolineales bacterium]
MPNLLLLSSEFPPGPGGIGTHAYELARNLTHFGWTITVVTRQDYVTAAEIDYFNSQLSFPVYTLQEQASFLHEWFYRWRSIASKLTDADVVVVSGERMVWLTAALTKRYRLPWVAIGHGTELGARPFPYGIVTRWAFQNASAVICVSQYTSSQMHERGIYPKENHIIPNGANAERFGTIAKEKLLAFKEQHHLLNKNLLVTVGHVSERKGQDIVIRALPYILKQFPDIHYLIIGLPTKQANYMQLARDLNVESHVHFLGRVNDEDLVYYLNASDLFIMTSRYTAQGDFEGYGIAVIEAALCGKPAIISRDSGLMEAIIDGKTGLSVPPESPQALAEAVISLMANPSQLAQFGRDAQERAANEQTWSQIVRQYDLILRGMIAQ